MPELPKVETIVGELRKKVKGKVVKDIVVKVPKLINLPIKDFRRQIRDKKIINISRRAKIIILDLTGPNFLLIHLKLTGQLVYQDRQGKKAGGGHQIKIQTTELPNKFTHIIFTFTDNTHLYFNDLRKFGWLKILPDQELAIINQEFGLEPLSQEFTFAKFKELLDRKKNWLIKKFLMDQSLIAGLGNIYTDESCFSAGIRPLRKIKSLSQIELQKLYQSIKKVLKLAIEKKGSSVDNYIQLDGSPGSFVPYLKVYGREGEKCKRCKKGEIVKIKLNGRGTHFCPKCQK